MERRGKAHGCAVIVLAGYGDEWRDALNPDRPQRGGIVEWGVGVDREMPYEQPQANQDHQDHQRSRSDGAFFLFNCVSPYLRAYGQTGYLKSTPWLFWKRHLHRRSRLTGLWKDLINRGEDQEKSVGVDVN